ncbi:Methyl-accepting chemotaxis protein II [Cupriavidus yeoncheonensis]|uniref:Methyl-accepting chemotaxis protein II n=1 Tax=Cupriavidus yeoncheonensis TaxID=1462994 RepID=A0A916N3N4_9BURK|nr:methyl-accepting chemotaxis protein [Cupriavidus yeoncheonensis]CAG2141861.1 Methyl-accepting chemotaxis protein II [Cupriavidus yeoncheonensis]
MSQFLQTIKFRIILTLTISISLTLLVGFFGLSGMSSLNDRLQATYTGNVVPITELANTRASTLNVRLLLWRTYTEKTRTHLPRIRELQTGANEAWKAYYPSGITNDEERAIADQIDAGLKKYHLAVAQALEILEREDYESAIAFQTKEITPVGDKLTELFAADLASNIGQAKDANAESSDHSREVMWIASTLIAIGTLLSIGVAVYLVRAVSGPLDKAVRLAGNIAQGRLDGGIVVDAKGEFGKLLNAMQQMGRQLTSTVRGIRDASESVMVASKEIANGNLDLSSRTEEQASSLEQTAASMTELTQTVKQNAENAQQANSLAATARDLADTSNVEVAAMMQTIGKVSGSSAQISEITGLIEGIAFQTNILALNAAVEAARAGEQGRGFAVVAGEVRSLAQRSSSAAKEIKDLIALSSAMVREGERQALKVGESMERVKQSIGQVSNIVSEISAASAEQSQGIEQVHQAISQIDAVTQQNAALVEESTAAAQSLEEQAGKMKTEVMFFRLGDEKAATSRHDSPSRSIKQRPKVIAGRPAEAKTVTAPATANQPNPRMSNGSEDWETF